MINFTNFMIKIKYFLTEFLRKKSLLNFKFAKLHIFKEFFTKKYIAILVNFST